MPWGVKKSGDNFVIYKKDTGKVVGHSTTRAKAEASVRARYANSKEFCDYNRNMSGFVNKVANRVLSEELEIDGEEFALIPENIASGLSGSMAAAFGIKKREHKMWVPKGRLEELKKLDAEIKAELKFKTVDGVLNLSDKYKYESVLVEVDGIVKQTLVDFQKSLPSNIVKELEDEPHITVIYGLEGENAEDVESVLSGIGPLNINFGKVIIFEDNEDYDVLVVEVDSDDVCMAHLIIASEFAVTSTHPCFKPHMTIAYLNKGEGKQYVGDARFENLEFISNKLKFSSKSGKKEIVKV